ncbi:hypothetical protein F7725_006531, partial [Dissostichus mawsoni]
MSYWRSVEVNQHHSVLARYQDTMFLIVPSRKKAWEYEVVFGKAPVLKDALTDCPSILSHWHKKKEDFCTAGGEEETVGGLQIWAKKLFKENSTTQLNHCSFLQGLAITAMTSDSSLSGGEDTAAPLLTLLSGF